LPTSIIDVLLHGWSGPGKHEAAARGDLTYDWLAPFERQAEFADLWREHRAELMAEWQRRGVEGQPWAAEQYGDGDGR
jgi:hypothetical protein